MNGEFVAMAAMRDDDLAFIYESAQLPPTGDELAGRGVALVFEHPSLRTRASSVAAVQQLGARLSMFTGDEVGLDVRESAEDVARTLQATADVLALRVRDHGVFARIVRATNGQLGVINLLSNFEHPTQAVADVLTLADHFGAGRVEELAGLKVAYVGDANNVTRSLAGALVRLGVVVTIAAPESRQLTATDLAQLRAVARGGGSVTLLEDPREAAAGANALYTDVWVSMGDESDAAQRRRELSGYQINESLLAHAAPGAVVLHCLPAHRGEEITDGVLESPQSLVWQQVRHRTSSMVGVLRWMKENHP